MSGVFHAALLSFLVTIGVFVIGIFGNIFLDTLKINTIEELNFEHSQYAASLVLEQQLYSISYEKGCDSLELRILNLIAQTSEFRKDLAILSGRSFLLRQDFSNWKHRTMLSQMYLYTLILQAKDSCNLSIHPILFFYREDHEPSITQASILDRIEDRNQGAIFVLHIDLDFTQEPLVVSFRERYGVTTPSVIISKDTIFPVVSNRRVLEDALNNYLVVQ